MPLVGDLLVVDQLDLLRLVLRVVNVIGLLSIRRHSCLFLADATTFGSRVGDIQPIARAISTIGVFVHD